MKAVVVAGTHSGCGKTTASLALMAALRARGLCVQAFKVGPDFIDPGHHAAITGRASDNLDGWMCGRSEVEDIFARASAGADVAVVEGVMGLFDGFSGRTEAGSTAEIAKWLGLPVLLVIDARSMARSAAAVALGFASLDPTLKLAGLVLNRVGSDNHKEILAEALAGVPGLPPAWFLPRSDDLALPSRHLGLVTAGEHALGPADVNRLATWLTTAVDCDALLASLPESGLACPADPPPVAPVVRLGLARDAAFCFYYPENLRRLAAAGAELVSFSPMADRHLPPHLDGLYLGGGYPEVHALALANNASLRKDVRRFVASGRPVLAECGGFMYLMEGIVNAHGQLCPMVGAFPFRARLCERFAALGYRQLTLAADTFLGPAGTMARGHEFHYSVIDGQAPAGELYELADRRGPRPGLDGYRAGNTLASYVHLHFGSNPDLAPRFVAACLDARAKA
jgi:cobyrinic acid a,c-diamide synthase